MLQCFTLDKFLLFNKNLLEWFLRIIWDLQIFFVETISNCAFNQEEKVGRCPILNSYPIKLTHRRCSKKRKAVLKHFAIFTGKEPCCLKLNEKETPTKMISCCEIFGRHLFCVRLLLDWLYEVIAWNFVSGQSLSNQIFKYN